jgi:hypothetical protein
MGWRLKVADRPTPDGTMLEWLPDCGHLPILTSAPVDLSPCLRRQNKQTRLTSA